MLKGHVLLATYLSYIIAEIVTTDELRKYEMPPSAYQLWLTQELIPFLQSVFSSRIRPDGTEGRAWDKAWYKMAQRATKKVEDAVSIANGDGSVKGRLTDC